MSYIFPNTAVKLLHDCPLDASQEHTIFFSTPEAQYEYFASLAKVTLPANSYQRVNKGEFKAAVLADDIYDCNYMMFQNASFGDRVFYAFIESVEYVSNTCTLIKYKLDVMQTWLFDYETQECFVERETPETDNLFEHLIPENLDCGTDTVYAGQQYYDMSTMSICIVCSKLPPGLEGWTQQIAGDFDLVYDDGNQIVNGVYTGLYYMFGYPVSTNRADQAGAAVQVIAHGNGYLVNQDSDYQYLGKTMKWFIDNGEDYIVSLFQYPAKFARFTNIEWRPSETFIADDEITVPMPDAIDGYVPKCRKLFTYPYAFVTAINNLGGSAEYKYENWGTGLQWAEQMLFTFGVTGNIAGTPSAVLYPKYYKGEYKAVDAGLTYTSFPQCAWKGDAWQAYWAQNKNSMVLGGIANTVGTIATASTFAATGHPLAAASYAAGGVAESVAQPLAKALDLQNTPPQIHGQLNNDNINAPLHKARFELFVTTIKREYAMAIDDYFWRYGYACHRCKHPNHAVRPHWTFTKTRGCTITGSVPAEDAREICNIYDKGITWWRHGEEVGHYELDNSPVAE